MHSFSQGSTNLSRSRTEFFPKVSPKQGLLNFLTATSGFVSRSDRNSTGPSVDPFFQSCQNKLNHALPLSAYLLKPIQRLTKYQLLIEQLVKYNQSGRFSNTVLFTGHTTRFDSSPTSSCGLLLVRSDDDSRIAPSSWFLWKPFRINWRINKSTRSYVKMPKESFEIFVFWLVNPKNLRLDTGTLIGSEETELKTG